MSTPTVTVAIIAYYRQYLEECIASVLAQTYDNFKVILCDDHSPENLKGVADRFDDRRLIYRRNETNLRTFGNTNNALKLCDTKYICVFHGDDVMFPWMIETLVAAAESVPEADLIVSRYRPVAEPERAALPAKPATDRASWTRYGKDDLIRKVVTHGNNLWPPAAFLFRATKIVKRGAFFRSEIGPAADLYYLIENNHNGMIIADTDCPLHFSRRHANTWSNLAGAESWERSLLEVCRYIDTTDIDVENLLRRNFAKNTIAGMAPAIRSSEDIAKLRQKMKVMKEANGWSMTDSDFVDAVTIGFLADTITKIGLRYTPISEFFKKSAELCSYGVTPPLSRKLKWLLKYVIAQRWMGIY